MEGKSLTREFNQKAAAFLDAMQQDVPLPDANDPFVDLEPDAEEEEHNEIVISIDAQNALLNLQTQTNDCKRHLRF